MKCIDRTFNILELFFDAESELSVNTLAESSGLSPAVVHRIVVSLSEKGYLTQKEKRGKYSLGLKFLKFYYAIRRKLGISKVSYPHLLDLCNKADEAVTLGILDDNEVLVIERLDVTHDLWVSGGVGRRSPLHSTAIGKLLIAQMSAEERKALFSSPAIVRFTEHTITDLPEMEKELELFKAEGCTFDRDETTMGVWSVAAPIYGSNGRIEAGIAVIMPTARVTDSRASELIALTKSCAAKICQELAYLQE